MPRITLGTATCGCGGTIVLRAEHELGCSEQTKHAHCEDCALVYWPEALRGREDFKDRFPNQEQTKGQPKSADESRGQTKEGMVVDVRWHDYDPPWAARQCSWCGLASKWFHEFGDVAVCHTCALQRHELEWFCFCAECYIALCSDCGRQLVCCGKPETIRCETCEQARHQTEV